MVTGHCSKCGKVWTLDERQGVCRWCGKLTTCQTTTTKPRHIKSSRRRRQTQVDGNGNDYDQLDGDWATYYKVASRFAHRAQAQDREDLLHDIMMTFADVKRNNGHKPFTEASMYRIASYTVADYWRSQYSLTNGLNCGSCSQEQRKKCHEDWLYADCPKAIRLEYLSKPIVDGEGNITELGELLADDKAIDLEAWVDARTWLLGCPKRLIEIAHKRAKGQALTKYEQLYLCRFWKRAQKRLL